MKTGRQWWIGLLLIVSLGLPSYGLAKAPKEVSKEVQKAAPKAAPAEEKPAIKITEDVGEAAKREAANVKKEIQTRAKSLFTRTPLGWDLRTVQSLFEEAVPLPSKIPAAGSHLLNEGRALGVGGSLLVLFFVLLAVYSIRAKGRAAAWAEKKAQPLGARIPQGLHPYFQSLLKVVVFSLVPLFLLAVFSLLDEMIDYDAAWFQLTGRLLGLWTIGAVLLSVLREAFAHGLFSSAGPHRDALFRYARLVSLYILFGLAALWTVYAFQIRPEFLELLRFAVRVYIFTLLLLFSLKKKAVLSFFPDLPCRGYRLVLGSLKSYYYLLLILSCAAALLWALGYHALGRMVLVKIWFTLGALLALSLVYYGISRLLDRWSARHDRADEAAHFLIRSLGSLLLYATSVFTAMIVLNLLGLLDPIQRIMSVPIFRIGSTPIAVWVILQVVLILLAFFFASRLLQAYLSYKVYPALGVDPGLGYALNTCIKYLFLPIGLLISLKLVGIDLSFLLVFAGAAGIGIGLGLQSLAASIISGFMIIFGGKIRKGDWIEVGGTLGVVTDIYLRATKVLSRANIEYLIPNSDLVSKTVVNYSLTSPFVWISLPVGVSYKANPREVERILLETAAKEPLVYKSESPSVLLVGYGDSAINFELYVCIDVRNTAQGRVRSNLYFAIFDAFAKAGIEIPFPQREIHIRSTASTGGAAENALPEEVSPASGSTGK